MYIEKRKLSEDDIRKIITVGRIILVVLFLVLLSAFWIIQILRNHHYTTLANRNITKDIEINAPRGFIVDRNYNRLSESKLRFTLFLVREDTQDLEKSIEVAGSITGMKKKDIIAKIEKYKNFPNSFMIYVSRKEISKNRDHRDAEADHEGCTREFVRIGFANTQMPFPSFDDRRTEE